MVNMQTFQVIAFILFILLFGLWALAVALHTAQYAMKRKVSFSALFAGLKPKLWMTAGLGCFFFALYGFIVLIASRFIDAEMRHSLFSAAKSHPTYFIYGGLLVFVLISLSILAVRSGIKRIYNSYHSKK